MDKRSLIGMTMSARKRAARKDPTKLGMFVRAALRRSGLTGSETPWSHEEVYHKASIEGEQNWRAWRAEKYGLRVVTSGNHKN